MHITEYLPQERRLRAVLSVHSAPLANHLTFQAQGGVEHVNRFNFVDGAKRTQALVNVTMSYRFGASH